MVKKWYGGMTGSGLVLLIGLQVSILADSLQTGQYSNTNIRLLPNSRFRNKLTPQRTLHFQESDELELLDTDTDFVDAQWTAKPKLRNNNVSKDYNQNFMSINKNVDQKDDTIKHFGDDHSKVALMEQYPSENKNEAPNTPSPISKTTRFNTEMSTEVDTTSFVTEAVTQPITTEIEYDVSTDEEEMLRSMHRRWRRNAIIVTQTMPLTTTQIPEDICSEQSYSTEEGCSCPPGTTGINCEEDLPQEKLAQQEISMTTHTGEAVGSYDDTDRANFETQLSEKYKDLLGFLRIYVYPITYNATSNFSTIRFAVFTNTSVTSNGVLRSSSIFTSVTSQLTPIKVRNLQVLWADEGTVTVTDEDGTIRSIPVSLDKLSHICYIFDQLNVCKNGGICVNETGEPVCSCTSKSHGKYCEALIVYIDDVEGDLLTVLLPVLVGTAALVVLCSWCFAFFRRANRGKDEGDTVSSVPPVALAVPKLFFRDTGWKQFSQAPVMAEEVVEEHRGVIVEELETDEIIEYHREVIERDFVEDEVIREPVYRYFSYNVPDRSHVALLEDTSSIISTQPSSFTVEELSSATTATTSWMTEAEMLGNGFHIDRPEYGDNEPL